MGLTRETTDLMRVVHRSLVVDRLIFVVLIGRKVPSMSPLFPNFRMPEFGVLRRSFLVQQVNIEN